MSLVASQRQLDVLRLVRAGAPITRSELRRRTGLSVSQVSRLVADLIEAGLVEADDRRHPPTGRPSDLLRLAGNGPWVVGVEVGAGRLDGVVANLRGDIRAQLRDRVPPVADHQAAVDLFAGFVARLLAESGLCPTDVVGYGVGLYAVVDPVLGAVIDWSEHPGWGGWWRGFGLRDALRERLGANLLVLDDAVRMRAVAEARRRAGAGGDFVFVLADSGIGAALVVDGKPYLGPNRLAGEIGHVSPDDSTAPCPCGRSGCLEAIASSAALEREAATRWPREQPDIGTVLALADLGDPLAAEVVERAGGRLAAVLASAVSLVCPAGVVLDGVLAQSARYVAAVERELGKRTHPRATSSLRVERSGLGAEAGVLGAAMAAIDGLFSLPPAAGTAAAVATFGADGRGGRQTSNRGEEETDAG